MDDTFETPLDVLLAGAGYGRPVKQSNIKNGDMHRIGLLWFNGFEPTIDGFHQQERRIQYLRVKHRSFKGQPSGTFPTNAIPVVQWKPMKLMDIPRVTIWCLSDHALRKMVELNEIEFLIQWWDRGKYKGWRFEKSEDKFLGRIVSRYGRRLFIDAAEALREFKETARVKTWRRCYA